MAEAPANSFVTTFEDSRRWRHIERRVDDIILSTPPKSGTTWTQGILSSLLWPNGDPPGSLGELSPWIDSRVRSIDDLVELLAGQEHRRFLKTHSPGDCIPFDQRCQYIVVYRSGPDALASWANHRTAMRPQVVEYLNALATTAGIATVRPKWSGDLDELFEEWSRIGSPVRHLHAWWPRRHAANLLFVHYNDLVTDLAGEMRRIADFLDLAVADRDWPQVVARCHIDRMRAAAKQEGRMDLTFDGGADSFFHKGGSGRGREILSETQLARCEQLAAEALPPEAAEWLGHGSIELGVRPDQIGTKVPPVQTVKYHPMFGHLAKAPSGTIDAIAERRVAQARQDGLFDNLDLYGKPIPDIDRQRPSGWWANRFVATERNKVTALQLEEELRKAMPALWRLATEGSVVHRVSELNAKIDRYNKATDIAPLKPLDPTETVATWHDLRAR